MGLGSLDETEFHHKSLRNTFCLLRPETIEQINHTIVEEGHRLRPDAIEEVRADSFVMETNVYYSAESSLLFDGIRKLISQCLLLAEEHGISGWRQHAHVLKKAKKPNRQINRIASKKGPNCKSRMNPFCFELLQETALLRQRAREL